MKTIKMKVPDKTLELVEKNAKELGYGKKEDYLFVLIAFGAEEYSPDVNEEHSKDEEVQAHSAGIMSRMLKKLDITGELSENN